jgi:hypothetical protein
MSCSYDGLMPDYVPTPMNLCWHMLEPSQMALLQP